MKLKTYLIGIIIIIGVILFNQCSKNKQKIEFKNKIHKLEKERDSLKILKKEDNFKIDSLNNINKLQNKKIDSITLLKQKIKIERQIVYKEIENLTENQYDSIINNKPKKEVVKTILGYPLLVQELVFADSLIVNLKANIKTLETKSVFQDNIIKNQEKEIINLLEQKNLYQKELNNKNNYGFMYIETNINGFDNYSIGLDYIYKEILIIGGNFNYDNLHKNINLKIKAGFKIF